MAAVAGPSAAIILIPQLDWWPQSYNATSTAFALVPGEINIYFLNISTTSLWPPTLNKTHLPNANCLAPTAMQNPLCPAGGYLDILKQTQADIAQFNLSIPGGDEFPLQFSRSLIATRYFATTASTPSEVLARSLWAVNINIEPPWENQRFTLTGLNGHGLLKPLVQVECQSYTLAPSLSIGFPNNGFITPPFPHVDDNLYPDIVGFPNIYQGQSWNVSVSSIGNTTDLEDHMRNDSLYFAWVDLSQYNPRPSIAAAVFSPSCTSSDPESISACSVDARWLPIDMWINPTQSRYVFDSYPNPLDLTNSLAGKNLSHRPLDIGIDWAQSLNLNLSESLTSMESLLQIGYANVCESNTEFQLSDQYFESTLAFALADGLARVGCGSNLFILEDNNFFAAYGESQIDENYDDPAQAMAALSNWTRLDIVFSRYGYGYGISTVTKRFAAAVLLGQAAIALATVAALALSKRISSSWSSVGELVALAINSKPTPKLKNTGAGVSRLDTWKEKVMVRATDERLQMIFEGDGRLSDYSKPDLGKKYA
jgi:hypothetical protein